MALFALLLTLSFSTLTAACDFSSEFERRRLTPEVVYLAAEVVDTPGWWKGGPTSPDRVRAFRADTESRVDVDPVALLRRQAETYSRIGFDIQKYTQIISGEIGRIEPMTCLEELMFERHLSIHGAGNEFVGLVLRKTVNDTGRLRLHMLSVATPYVSFSDFFRQKIEADLAEGWTLHFHLHNHPFLFDNSLGDVAGTIIPSDPDLRSYAVMAREWSLPRARITNGFHTLELGHDEFSRVRLTEE